MKTKNISLRLPWRSVVSELTLLPSFLRLILLLMWATSSTLEPASSLLYKDVWSIWKAVGVWKHDLIILDVCL